jgi:hypothetical protein
MENNNSVLEKVFSKDLLSNIFDYIRDPNYKHKLFSYSKLLQKKANLRLADYEERYIEKFGINLNDYLFSENNKFVRKFNKDILNSNLQKDLSKNNLEKAKIEKIMVDIYNQRYEDKYKNNSEGSDKAGNKLIETDESIEIYSPFFETLSKMEFFEYLFTINISTYIIDKFDLKEDYISTFEKLNQSKSKYNSLTIYYEDSYDILYLKDFKINFNQIKRIIFIPNSYHVTGDYKYFLNTFFSFFSRIEKNLTNLKLKWVENEMEPRAIQNLNNFKSLELLNLTGFKFTKTFVLKLSNLKKLTLDSCENIDFEENIFSNIIKLNLYHCSINKPKSLLAIPNLEECELTYYDGESEQKYYSIFDISSFKKLKKFVGDPCDFIYLEENNLEYVKLISYTEVSSEDRTKVLKKLVSLKNLKELILEFGPIVDSEILWIIGKNYSVEKMKINWVKQNNDLVIYNLQDKFGKLSNIEMTSPKYENNHKIILNITENRNCRINKFYLEAGMYHNIEFYCQPFENLIEIKLTLNGKVINIKDALPIFNKDCKVIFRALNVFELRTISDHVVLLYAMENLCNNLTSMPNLTKLLIDCSIQENIDKDFYINFIKKCLELKLKKLYFSIKKTADDSKIIPYSKEELEEIYPNIKYSKYKEIFIRKLNN